MILFCFSLRQSLMWSRLSSIRYVAKDGLGLLVFLPPPPLQASASTLSLHSTRSRTQASIHSASQATAPAQRRHRKVGRKSTWKDFHTDMEPGSWQAGELVQEIGFQANTVVRQRGSALHNRKVSSSEGRSGYEYAYLCKELGSTGSKGLGTKGRQEQMCNCWRF